MRDVINYMVRAFKTVAIILFVLTQTDSLRAQSVVINLAQIDGVDITPDNALSFTIESFFASSKKVQIAGQIRYRSSDLRINYLFDYILQPGSNLISASQVNPNWQFSSTALRELFMQHKMLPQGTYEYCVSVTNIKSLNETDNEGLDQQCLYRKSDDVFLINLLDPENKAKIYEYNPLLSWTANYSFLEALTYRIRIAEIKDGQNTQNAINRNNPIYEERNLMQMSIMYPIYAKPLQPYQPYAWTVDAYYKGILLGGAEPWSFIIIEDSLLMASIPKETSYLNIKKEKGGNQIFAIGKLKLMYDLRELKTDTLYLQLKHNGEDIKINNAKLEAHYGDNRYDLEFKGKLKHLKIYELHIRNTMGEHFIVLFRYINPEYL